MIKDCFHHESNLDSSLIHRSGSSLIIIAKLLCCLDDKGGNRLGYAKL